MRLAFMSSVLPELNLAELVERAKSHGYEGIELRPEWGHAHGVELDGSAAARREARSRVADSGVEACCLSPGIRFCKEDRGELDAELEKLLRYIELASETGIGRIRVFGDPIPDSGRGRREAAYRTEAEYFARGAARAAEAGVKLCLETHSNFRAFDAGEVLYRAAYPSALTVNWHLGHCLRHGEDVDEAYRHVKGRVGHVHFSLREEKVDPPYIERQAELLAAEGYGGYFSVEVINPEDGEEVLRQHAGAWRDLRGRLGS